MNSSPVPVRMRISFSGSAPTTLSIWPRARWFCTLSWTGPPAVCAATSSTPSSRRLIVKKSLKCSRYSANRGVGRNSCSDMRCPPFCSAAFCRSAYAGVRAVDALLRLDVHAGGSRLDREQREEVGVAVAAADRGLQELEHARGQRHRHLVLAGRRQPEVEVLAQQLGGEGRR